jgi:CRP-like cAMP-binding protein
MADSQQWERFTTPRNLHVGETLFKEGDPGREMFIVTSGQVMITKETPQGDPLVLGYRGAGEFIGEIALISDSPRTATVVAVKPTQMLVISHEEFWRRLRSDEDFRQVVMNTLIGRLLSADESRVMAEMWERQLTEGVTSLATEQERLGKIIALRRQTLHFIIHDLRNPLNLAITALAMIELEPEDPRIQDIQQFVTMAQSGLSRVMLLVDSLLDVERLEHGDDQLHIENVDVRGA